MTSDKFKNDPLYFRYMGNWKTYLIMYFGDKGTKVTDVVSKIEALGFETRLGSFDFSYNWGENEPEKAKALELGNKVAEAIKDTGVIFALDTHD